jgi:hypothetical protein
VEALLDGNILITDSTSNDAILLLSSSNHHHHQYSDVSRWYAKASDILLLLVDHLILDQEMQVPPSFHVPVSWTLRYATTQKDVESESSGWTNASLQRSPFSPVGITWNKSHLGGCRPTKEEEEEVRRVSEGRRRGRT